MIRPTIMAVAIALGLAGPVTAQDQSLADIRQQLSMLYVDIQGLRSELTSTGALTSGSIGNTPLERLNAIEFELQRLTSKTEELENRINRITRDGTNRIGDLEFRLCELEEGCDIAALGDTPMLGGVDNGVAVPAPQGSQATVGTGPELAIGERADFDRAKAALDAGDYLGAADQFSAYSSAYPGGPLVAQAQYLRGEAFSALGQTTNAARAYLDSFTTDQVGEFAPDALFKLGTTLGSLGQKQDACITLSEVSIRFPTNNEAVLDAQSAMQNLGCN